MPAQVETDLVMMLTLAAGLTAAALAGSVVAWLAALMHWSLGRGPARQRARWLIGLLLLGAIGLFGLAALLYWWRRPTDAGPVTSEQESSASN